MESQAIAERVRLVQERVQRACRRSGRSPSDITVVCVTKHARIEDVAAVVRSGWRILGENRAQEAERKQAALSAVLSPTELAGLQWHMIGHLQTNKAARVVGWASLIQSVDSVRLAQVIDRAAAGHARRIACLAQVNISQEQAKFGTGWDQVEALISGMQELSHVDCAGLMGIAPLAQEPELSRPYFARLRQLWEELNLRQRSRAQPQLRVLSMGMSNDFEVAIEEGATMVRVGTAIFGG